MDVCTRSGFQCRMLRRNKLILLLVLLRVLLLKKQMLSRRKRLNRNRPQMRPNALSLLRSYDSSDSSSSSSDEETQEEQRRKRLKLPVPDIVLPTNNGNSTRPENEDDPSLHEGRIRSFPHERGNWASFISTSCDIYETECLHELTPMLLDILPTSLNVKEVDDYHITLTRTFILKHHWIDLFVSTVRTKVPLLKSFIIYLKNIKIYCNEERTRTFIGYCVQDDTKLKDVVKRMDECLTEFNLPTYYKEPSFHISLAWCVGDHKTQLETYMTEFNKILKNHFTSNGRFVIKFDDLKCKIGHKTYTFPIN